MSPSDKCYLGPKFDVESKSEVRFESLVQQKKKTGILSVAVNVLPYNSKSSRRTLSIFFDLLKVCDMNFHMCKSGPNRCVGNTTDFDLKKMFIFGCACM